MRVYIAKPDPPPVETSFLRKYSVAIILLVALALLAFGLSALTPSLFGDEWSRMFTHTRAGGLACPDSFTDARPLGKCWQALVYRLAGTNLIGHHALAILMNLTSALLLLATLDVLLPGWPTYNSSVAALYLVLPADMTRIFLDGAVVQGTVYFLLAAYFMARFWRDGRWWAWFASLAAIAVSLATYEITLGLFVVLPVLAALFARHHTWPRRVALLVPVLVAMAFSIWRWRWQKMVGSAFGHPTEEITISPLHILKNLITSLKYLLGEAWSQTIIEASPRMPWDNQYATLVGLGVTIGLVILTVSIACRVSRDRYPNSAGTRHAGTKEDAARTLLVAGSVGAVMMMVGYFPIILSLLPRASYTVTRLHQLPSVGAAMFICAIIFGIGHWLGQTPKRARFIALAGLAPLLVIGIVGHVTMARHLRIAWADQKLIWNSLFEQAPSIADGTYVFIALSGYKYPSRWPHPLENGPSATTRALRVLYSTKLDGSYEWAPLSSVLSIDGDKLRVGYPGASTLLSPETTIVFTFDQHDKRLIQIKELERDGKVLLLGPDRISPTPTDKTEWRWLVAD